MYKYDVSKSNMWREVHEQPEIIRQFENLVNY